jgi:predicted nucleic acid-binding protein
VERIEHQNLVGFTSTHVLSEMAHRLMAMEASALFGWPFAGIARRLGQHPGQVQTLSRFRQAIQEVPQYRIQVLTIPPQFIDAAAALSQQAGLLSNDALVVAVMQANGLTKLASNDADFDRVPGLTRYAPV